MAITHALPGLPVDVRPLGVQLAQARTTALFKSTDLEVIRLVLMAGKGLPPHRVPGEITVHCLEGRLEVSCDGRLQYLSAGELLYVPGGVLHGLEALEDASALVTIALRS